MRARRCGGSGEGGRVRGGSWGAFGSWLVGGGCWIVLLGRVECGGGLGCGGVLVVVSVSIGSGVVVWWSGVVDCLLGGLVLCCCEKCVGESLCFVLVKGGVGVRWWCSEVVDVVTVVMVAGRWRLRGGGGAWVCLIIFYVVDGLCPWGTELCGGSVIEVGCRLVGSYGRLWSFGWVSGVGGGVKWCGGVGFVEVVKCGMCGCVLCECGGVEMSCAWCGCGGGGWWLRERGCGVDVWECCGAVSRCGCGRRVLAFVGRLEVCGGVGVVGVVCGECGGVCGVSVGGAWGCVGEVVVVGCHVGVGCVRSSVYECCLLSVKGGGSASGVCSGVVCGEGLSGVRWLWCVRWTWCACVGVVGNNRVDWICGGGGVLVVGGGGSVWVAAWRWVGCSVVWVVGGGVVWCGVECEIEAELVVPVDACGCCVGVRGGGVRRDRRCWVGVWRVAVSCRLFGGWGARGNWCGVVMSLGNASGVWWLVFGVCSCPGGGSGVRVFGMKSRWECGVWLWVGLEVGCDSGWWGLEFKWFSGGVWGRGWRVGPGSAGVVSLCLVWCMAWGCGGGGFVGGVWVREGVVVVWCPGCDHMWCGLGGGCKVEVWWVFGGGWVVDWGCVLVVVVRVWGVAGTLRIGWVDNGVGWLGCVGVGGVFGVVASGVGCGGVESGYCGVEDVVGGIVALLRGCGERRAGACVWSVLYCRLLEVFWGWWELAIWGFGGFSGTGEVCVEWCRGWVAVSGLVSCVGGGEWLLKSVMFVGVAVLGETVVWVVWEEEVTGCGWGVGVRGVVGWLGCHSGLLGGAGVGRVCSVCELVVVGVGEGIQRLIIAIEIE
ncbi:hypothetical protein Tco_0122338 [Tanacetum coccineum]